MASYSAAVPLTTWSWNIFLFGVGALTMRGAGCSVNDLWDKDLDDKVERTKLRPLASKAISHKQAIAFLGLQLSVGLAVLTQMNFYSILLGAASLPIVFIYPFMKRVTFWPQSVLGLAFNWGALLGSSAVLGACNWQVAVPLYAGSVAWTLVYDTIYAHQDKADDVHVGIKSTALLFGDNTRPILAGFSAVFLSLLAYSGYVNGQGLPFYAVSIGGAAAHLSWQLSQLNLKGLYNGPLCWKLFRSNRDLGYIVFAGLLIDYLYLLYKEQDAAEKESKTPNAIWK